MLARQAKLGASCGVQVPVGKGLATHPYRVLRLWRSGRRFLRTKQAKRTQRIMQAVGESALPEVLVSLRNELVPVAEGCNVRRRQYKIIR